MADITSDQVNTAIDGILDGEAQSYSIGDRSFTALDSDKLLKLRRELQWEESRASGNGGLRLAKFQRPGE